MPGVRDFLSRFRPAGAPGAGRAAVPADRRHELEAELGPVLALLDEPGATCADVIAAAQRDAEQAITVARSEAAAIVRAGRERATSIAAGLVQQAVAAAQAEAELIVAAGARDAASIRERARQRVPMLADRAVSLIRDLADPGRADEAAPQGRS